MKKKLSLLPLEMRRKRELYKIKKYGAIIIAIPIIVTAFNGVSYGIKSKQLVALEEKAAQVQTATQNIDEQKKLSQEKETIIRNLELSGIPLNKFMLFMGTELPEDIRVYEITRNVESSGDEEATSETNGENGEGVQSADASAEQPTPEQNEENQTSEPNAAEKVIDGAVQGVKEAIDGTQIGDDIIVKGAGLKVDSVAKFVESIKMNNEYVSDVEISDIQNYNNGEFNYKMFEMKIKIR